MDTHELTSALHEATDGLEPRADFAVAVLRGGRRRRTRGRVAIGAALAGTAAVAVLAAVVVPNQLSAPPPAEQPDGPAKTVDLLTDSGGDLIDDEGTVRLATTGWQDAVDGTPANADGHLNGRKGNPHVYWAGTTPAGPAALVTQAVVLPSDDTVEPTDRGREVTAVGLLVTNPADTEKRELELVAVQLDGDHNGRGGYFMFPDNRTVLGIEPTELGGKDLSLFVSPNTAIGPDGRSRRQWTPLAPHDGVAFVQLPAPADPRNVRLVVGDTGGDPNAGEQKMGAHIPLLAAVVYIDPTLGVDRDNGPGWPPEDVKVGYDHELARSPVNLFGAALRESTLLDPASFEEVEGQWLVVAGLANKKTMIVGSYQEVNNPAYFFYVLVRSDGSVESVTRGPQVDPSALLPVVLHLPGGDGWVVAANVQQLSHRSGGAWSTPVADADLVPADATQVRVGDQVVDLPN
ncbi:MAG: hypothetical protein GEV28_36015 [Actinophytocola sp.]|uniref:hypothetical protein n=1 Tax=Actinophytocola sp. TaxID=1872138 RepID=UPI00132A6C66|nr:hypothetical protein [Actinophytocola sp.]MPZ85499.1 hypothetical protein [Actinophytocola sp.]